MDQSEIVLGTFEVVGVARCVEDFETFIDDGWI